MKIFCRYDKDAPRPKVDFAGQKSMTNQADKDSADVNKIISRFERTGNILDLNGNSRTPVWGDFSGIGDYHAMKCAIARADQVFAVLPAAVRNRFDNDPAKLMAFLDDTANDAEALKLGLKDASNALVCVADDGVTKITQKERAVLDKAAAAKAAAAGAGAGAAK